MINNFKDSYAVKIRPDFDKKNIEKFKKDVSGSKVGMLGNTFKSTTSKVVGLIGAMSLMGLAVSSIRKAFDEANTGFQEFLDTTDRLSTLAGDLPNTSAGQLAFADASLKESGIKTTEERDKLFRSIQDAIASGVISNPNNKGITDILASLQTQWQNAKLSGNTQEMSTIEKQIGLRGKKASEFLQGDIKKSIEDRQKTTGVTEEEITNFANQGGISEGKQAKNQGDEQIRRLSKVGQTLNETNKKGKSKSDIINESQAQMEKNRTDLLVSQINAYESSVKSITKLDTTMKGLEKVMIDLLPHVGTIATKLSSFLGVEDNGKTKAQNNIVNVTKNNQNFIDRAIQKALSNDNNTKQTKR